MFGLFYVIISPYVVLFALGIRDYRIYKRNVKGKKTTNK